MTSASNEKWRPFNCLFFQSREQVTVRRGQIRRIGWVIKTLEAKVGQFLLACKCPMSRGIVQQEQDPLVEIPAVFFLQKCPSIAPADLSNTPRWKCLPLEDNQWEGCRLDPKKSEARIFPRIFALRIFWGGVSCYAVTPLIVALSPGHSDITRFRPWSPIAKGNHEIAPELTQTTGNVDFLIRVQAFRDPLSGELPHDQIFMNYGPNLLTWDVKLLCYWFSRNPVIFQD